MQRGKLSTENSSTTTICHSSNKIVYDARDCRSSHGGPGVGGTKNPAIYPKMNSSDNSNSKHLDNESKAAYSIRMKSFQSKKTRQGSGTDREHDELDIVKDSGASEFCVAKERNLIGMEKIPAMPVEVADGTRVNATHQGIVTIHFEVGKSIPCRAYIIFTMNLSITSCARLDKYG